MNRLYNKFINPCFLNKIIIILLLIDNSVVYSSVDIKDIAVKLSNDLQRVKNDELGISFVVKLYNNFKSVPTNTDIRKNVRIIAQKMETKITDTFSALENAKTFLEETKTHMNITNIPSTFIPCLQTIDRDAETYKMIFNGLFTDNNTLNENHLETGYILQRMRRNMSSTKHAVKQQYFISDVDVKKLLYSPFSGCTGRDDIILWKNYLSRNKYKRKNVILLLDRGVALSKQQFHLVKSTAKQLISALNTTDRVAVLNIATDWFALANSTDCLLPNQIPQQVKILPNLKYAENTHKNTLYAFIDSLTKSTGLTNHTLGLEIALKVIKTEIDKLQNETVMILYISRGLSSLTETKDLLKMIEEFTRNMLNTSVVINTCAVIDESKPPMFETHFLRDIAEQNYKKFNITTKLNNNRQKGFMLTLNSTDTIGFVVSRFYSIFNPNSLYETEQKISLPTWDPISNDLSISFTVGWLTNKNDFAMLGVDLYFSNLVEDITYYSSNQQYTYAFLVDLSGKVLMHPSFPRPSTVNHQLYFVDVARFEKVMDTFALRDQLLTETYGFYIEDKYNNSETMRLAWHRVGEWYVVCIIVHSKFGPANRPFRAVSHPSISNNKLLYQNLDRQDNTFKLCKHLNQIATLDASSLYLSMSCFQSPFSAARSTQDRATIQGYIAYLKDDTRLLANPGLKDEVRDEVAALTHVMEILRKRHIASLMSKYIVRRYASSRNGVLQMFPGSILGPGLEPTKRPWFLTALKHKGKVVLIPPYLDGGGAGYIVTIAYALAQTVIAIDLTYGYMFKLLLEHMPECLEENITCFLMDDRGYLIYHPNLMESSESKPIELQHIVHKELFVANDILNHNSFIRKMLCNYYGDSTIQRYYQLNTSFDGILSNFMSEHCVSYRITMLQNTNVFIGIINTTCSVVATFCPCSVVDRLCFNCNRMEQKECECPCECPLNVDTEVCRNPNRNITDNPPCTWYAESISANPTFMGETDKQMDICLPNSCQIEQTYLGCLGLTGCEWCKYDVDGNYLRKPFCASLNTCFNGVFGSISPYRSDITETILSSDYSDYSPIGPILGSVIAMCVLLVLLFICYRSYTSPSTERLYLSSTQDNHLRMSDLNVNDNYHDLGNHRDKLLQEDRPDPVSPYCVASTYRRTTAPADSDHGYSTMTPHDESEHLSLAPVEVDSLEDDLTSDNTSVHTSISTKHVDNMSPSMFTRLPNRNCIVVPVTVHRNMEMT